MLEDDFVRARVHRQPRRLECRDLARPPVRDQFVIDEQAITEPVPETAELHEHIVAARLSGREVARPAGRGLSRGAQHQSIQRTIACGQGGQVQRGGLVDAAVDAGTDR